MTDWLDEIEERKRRERQARDEEWERGRPAREARAAAAAACYERNKEAINRVFSEISSYVERANQLTNAELIWKLKEHKGKLVKNGYSRELEVIYYHDDDNETFSIWAKYPKPWKKGDPWGAPTLYHRYNFHIPIRTVSKQHISEWVKWVSTGDPLPAYWRDVIGGELKSNVKSEGCLYSAWTYIIIIGIILFVIYLSQK